MAWEEVLEKALQIAARIVLVDSYYTGTFHAELAERQVVPSLVPRLPLHCVHRGEPGNEAR